MSGSDSRRIRLEAEGLLARFGLAVLLAAAAVLPYLPSLTADLVWDDRLLIIEEQRFHSPNYVFEVLTGGFFDDIDQIYRYGYYRPLVSLSLYATWRLFGEDPLPYHATNIALHLAATLLLYAVLLSLFRKRRPAAFLGAAVFAVHPVHVETVAWVAGRTDSITAIAVLASAWFLVRWFETARTTFLVGFAALSAAAPFAKEAALFWPLLVVVCAAASPVNQRRRWMTAATTAVVSQVPYLALRTMAADTGPPPLQWAADQYPAVAWTFFATFLRYLGELLPPWHLEPYIQNPLRPNPLDLVVLGGLVAFVGSAWWAWKHRQQRPGVAVAVAFFLLSFAPLSNLVRISGPADMGAPMAERFLYIPSLAFAAVIGWGLASLVGSARRSAVRVGTWALFVVACLAAAAASAAGSQVWSTETRLFRTMVDQAPQAPLPNFLLGTVACRNGDWQACERWLDAALRLAPPDRGGLNVAIRSNLAGAEMAQGRTARARALLLEAVSNSPPVSGLHFNLAIVRWMSGDAAGALHELDRALELNPWHPQALVKRARVRLGMGRLDGAQDDLYRFDRRFEPTAESETVRGLLAGRRGDDDAALDALKRAGRLGSGEALSMIGGWHLSRGQWRGAEEALAAAVELGETDERTVLDLARVRIRLGRPTDAVEALIQLMSAPSVSDTGRASASALAIEAGRSDLAERWRSREDTFTPGTSGRD